MKKRIIWINKFPHRKGGAERVIENIVNGLDPNAYESVLLYDFKEKVNDEYVTCFDFAFPIVDLSRQLKELNPDSIQVHNYIEEGSLLSLLEYKEIVCLFFHDHQTLCPRVHKYTLLNKATCSTQMSYRKCLLCMGYITNSENGLSISTPFKLFKLHDLIKKFKGVFVASVYMRDQLLKLGYKADSIFYHQLFTYMKPQNNRKLNVDKILYFGQLETGKGIDILIRSLANTRGNLKLYICGKGKGEDSLRKLVAVNNLCDRVHFLGYLKDAELIDHIESSLCVMTPGRSPETFNMAALESLFLGTPVVSSDIGAYQEWHIEGVTGEVFKSNCIQGLSEILQTLNNDKSRWLNYRNKIKSSFDSHKYSVEKYVNFFTKTIGLSFYKYWEGIL